MTINSVIIGLLLGIVANIATFLATKHYTTQRDRQTFKDEGREYREATADAAVGHLRSSYLAVKKLSLGVLDQQRGQRDEKFGLVLWGIAQSLEQIRLGLLGHMNVWKNSLPQDSDAAKEVQRFLGEDIVPRPAPATSQEPPTPKANVSAPTLEAATSLSLFDSLRTSPQEAMLKQIMTGDKAGLEARLRDAVGSGASVSEIVTMAAILAPLGSTFAKDQLRLLLKTRANELSRDESHVAFGSMLEWYIRADKEADIAGEAESLAEPLMSEPDLNDKDRAWICNQIGKILYSAKDYARAVQWQEKAAQLRPDDAAYSGNTAMCYDKLGDIAKAEQWFERSLETDHEHAKHIFEALQFYSEIGRRERVDTLLPILDRQDPTKAQMFRMFDKGKK